MAAPKFLIKQFAKPSGWLSSLAARALNKTNATQNRATVDALPLTTTSRVLDIGFGGGVSLEPLLQRCANGLVAGSEVSPEMIQRAKKIWAKQVGDGKLDLREAGAEKLPWQDDSFDFVMTVNTMYFWPDVLTGLAEIKRVLAPGGKFVTSCVPRNMLASLGFGDMGYRTEEPEHYAELMKQAGFEGVEVIPSNDMKKSKLLVGRAPG